MIKLNSDLGEGFGVYSINDESNIMPYIDMANIACGFHAGDPLTIQKTVLLALQNGVEIGAHPGYPDLVGFGRRSLKCKSEEIEAFVIYQIGALNALVMANGGVATYVKPHGALYNDMMQNDEIFISILRAIDKYDKNLKLMILSTSNNKKYEKIASKYGVKLMYEVFADRAYTKDGFLVPRTEYGAVLSSHEEVEDRLIQLIKDKTLTSIDNITLTLQADSLCVHGDNEEAIALVKSLREILC